MKYILTTFLFLFAGCQSGTMSDIMIRNVNIVDVEAGVVLENRNVFIKKQTIARISSDDSEDSADRIIDGTGKYLIPGLWDMHVHFRGGEELIEENKNLLPLYIANGVTTVRDGGGDITPAVLEWKRQIAAGELAGPKIFTSGPKLDGPSPGWNGSIEIENRDQVSSALDSLEALGADYVKIYDSTLSGDLFLAIVEEAVQRDLPVTGHMPFDALFSETVESGLSATEHIFYAYKGSSGEEEAVTEELNRRQGAENPMEFREALERLMETQDQDKVSELYQKMADNGTGIIPTLHIMEVLANLTERDHSEDKYLAYIGPGIRETYQGRLQAALSTQDDQALNIYDLPGYRSMIPGMAGSGVRVYAGSDAGPYNTFVYPGISLHYELALLVESGLTPFEALRTATLNPPGFFGLEREYGQVKEGFTADLVLLEANPLEKISNTKQIDKVIVNGTDIFEKRDLEQMLEELAAEYE